MSNGKQIKGLLILPPSPFSNFEWPAFARNEEEEESLQDSSQSVTVFGCSDVDRWKRSSLHRRSLTKSDSTVERFTKSVASTLHRGAHAHTEYANSSMPASSSSSLATVNPPIEGQNPIERREEKRRKRHQRRGHSLKVGQHCGLTMVR